MNILSASLVADSDTSLRGFIEVATPELGIIGWALDLEAPNRPLRIELLIDGMAVAECSTDRVREDIKLSGFPPPRAGFRFDPSACRRAAEAAGAPPDAPFSVRLAGAEWLLRAAAPLPTVAELVPPAGQAPLPPERPASVPAAAVGENPSAALRQMELLSERLLKQPLTPATERVVGYLEAIAWEQTGLIWVFGWMQRHLPRHFPAVVSDRAKYRAALVLAGYDRADLPDGAIGVCGVLRTDWRPATRGSAPWIYFGEAAQYAVPAVDSLTFLSDAECVRRIEGLRGDSTAEAGFIRPLRKLLAATRSWAPDNARAAGLEVRANLDRLLILPGFGCLAEGWVLSPLQPVSHFMLRIGKTVLVSDATATSRKARPDLLNLAPNGQTMVARAGFVTAFTGRVEEEDLGDIILKIVLADGSSTNHRVELGCARIVGHSAAIADLLQLFPAIHAEAFFPALSVCVGERLGRDVRRAEEFAAHPSREVLVVAAPDDPSDMSLLFDDLSRLADRGRPVPAIAVLACASEHRASVLAHYHDLRGDAEDRISLFFVADPGHAIYALPEILARLEAERFAFIGPNVIPTEAGWDAILEALASGRNELLIQDRMPAEALGQGMAVADPAECFLWNRRDVTAWLTRMPTFIGGLASRKLLLPEGIAHRVEGLAAWRGRRPEPGYLAQRINTHLQIRQAEERDA